MARLVDWFAWALFKRSFYRRCDTVLGRAYRMGRLSSEMRHELDHRMKYEPDRRWTKWGE